ncbi:putative cytochrome p450 monooxygenase (lova) [Fusarium flagelliforme]|uniref:Putative cytochrome p450 monooxygenase (Lova) n=1 Tax=Fusarium flagelliforme TaxID=2675880 RepID=A0A395MLV0_9HYPO|nr:putative cytochrome p450 monooxygenase (lova) [Fusarium flagelliforme]
MSTKLDTILENPQYAILCGITVFTLVIVQLSLFDRGGKYPLLNPKGSFELTTNRVVREFINDSVNILEKGKSLFKGQLYRANTDWGQVVVIPPQFLDALKSHKDLNFIIPAQDDSHGYIPGFEPFTGDHNLSKVVNKYLTKALRPLSEEASLAFRHVITDSPEWHEIQPQPAFVRIISRMSSRVFMGEDLCRNEEWVRLAGDYTVQSFKTGDMLRMYPRWSRPFVHHFLPSCKELRRTLDAARKCLNPYIERRNAIKAEALAKGEPCPFDTSFEWFEKEYSEYDPATSQLSLSLVAIHTTTDLLMETVFNIAKHPELLAPLREEIVRVLSTEGLKKTALLNLKLMDSVLKESQRLRPVLLGSFRRLAMADVTLPNGDVIKKGTKILCSTTHMWSSDSHESGEKFDGYRFLHMREKEEAEKSKTSHPHLVSPSSDHLGFGYGNHACPGRFFAANELKVALCHMLLKYDWKFAGDVVPKPFSFGMAYMPDLGAKLLIRRRSEELDIDSVES